MKQRGASDCVLACLANATGKNYNDIFPEEFRKYAEDHKGLYGKTFEQAFEYAGLKAEVDYTAFYCGGDPLRRGLLRFMLWGRRALIQVPSLNNPPPNMHLVYWDGVCIHDPSNKQQYTHIDQMQPQYIYFFNEVGP